MTEQETNTTQAAELRHKAEEIIQENAGQSPEDLPGTQTLHELRVHQIELEMQNRELHRTQAELDTARARYFDLYDLAPVGYLTVSKNGLILEANFTAATLLGVARGALVKMIFSSFILKEDQGIYYQFRKQLFETGKSQACELRMVKKENQTFWVHQDATVAQDSEGGPVSRIVMSDITEPKLKEAQDLLEQMVEERSRQLRKESEAPTAEGADTILLVDDEPHILAAMTRSLRNTGYEVFTAAGGSQALAIMETTKIKVIVSDEQMEGMRGSALLAEVQKRFPLTLRILVSGYTTQEMAMRAVNEGEIYRFFTKPWDDAMLRLALSAATEKYNLEAEKRRLAEELRKAEKSLQTTLDGLASHIALLDTDGTILFVNRSWREFAIQNSATGDSVYEGANYLKVCDEATGERSEGAARFATGIRAVLSGEMDQFIFDYPCIAPDEKRWFVGRVSSFTDEKPRRTVVISHMDITVRKQAEKALQEAHDLLEQRVEERTVQLRQEIEAHKGLQVTLRESEERLQLAIKAADVGIWEWDVVSNRLTWDETIYRFYGIAPDKFGGAYEAWEAGLHPEDLPKSREAFQRALRGEEEYNDEFRVVWPDGSIHWMKTSARIERDSEGKPMRVIGTNLDITRDKLLLETAEVANRAKSLFIGNMSHELRTPLSGVLGMTELLLKTPVTVKQRDYAESIMKCGKSLLVIVSNILDFSKSSAGNMNLESAPFFLEAVIANVVNLFGPSVAEEKKFGLHTTIDPELPALLGDAQRLTQVISNLVGNAVKFTKTGAIRVSAKILRRTETEIDLSIGVQDTGIGMTEEELSRVFRAFTQGDTSTGRRFGGTGLGLTISRNLVELMGGTIQVESVFGKGSLFTVLITFPIAQGFARSDFKSVPINPVVPATPARPELPPGDMAELQTLLEQLREPLDNGEPMPCKDILATLLAKSWPEAQETLLVELNRLVKRYRLQEALDLLTQETEPERVKKEIADTVSAIQASDKYN